MIVIPNDTSKPMIGDLAVIEFRKIVMKNTIKRIVLVQAYETIPAIPSLTKLCITEHSWRTVEMYDETLRALKS
jgi:hypothetical protein